MPKLTAILGLDASAWGSGLRKAESDAKRFSASVGNSFKNQVAGLVGVGALTALGKKTIDAASKIQDLHQRTSVSTDALQEWDYALKQNGGTLEDFTSFIEKLAVARGKAAAGDDAARKSLEALGITMDDVKGKLRSEDLARKIGLKFEEGGDQQKLIAAMKEIGGRGAGAMVATFVAGFDEAAKEAHALGLIIDGEVIQKLDNVGDRMAQAGQKIIAAFAVPLVWLTDKIEAIVNKIGDLATYVGNLAGGGNFESASNAVASRMTARMAAEKARKEADVRKGLAQTAARQTDFGGNTDKTREATRIANEIGKRQDAINKMEIGRMSPNDKRDYFNAIREGASKNEAEFAKFQHANPEVMAKFLGAQAQRMEMEDELAKLDKVKEKSGTFSPDTDSLARIGGSYSSGGMGEVDYAKMTAEATKALVRDGVKFKEQ